MINFIKRRFSTDEDGSASASASASTSASSASHGPDGERTLFSDLQVQIPKLLDNFSTYLPSSNNANAKGQAAELQPSAAAGLNSAHKMGGSVGNIPQQLAAQNNRNNPNVPPPRALSQTRQSEVPPAARPAPVRNRSTDASASANAASSAALSQQHPAGPQSLLIAQVPHSAQPRQTQTPTQTPAQTQSQSQSQSLCQTQTLNNVRNEKQRVDPASARPACDPHLNTDPPAQRNPNVQRDPSPNYLAKRSGPAHSAPASPLRSVHNGDPNAYRMLFTDAPRCNADDRKKVLLVIDDSSTDWSKYFNSRRIALAADISATTMEHYEIRLEQAAFQDLHVVAYAETGAIVQVSSASKKPVNDDQSSTPARAPTRTFKPDFVLVRQAVRNGTHNWTHIIIALDYAGVQGINSLSSIYAFQDKPWIFSQMLKLRRKFGQQQFPVIDQTFFPSPANMANLSTLLLPVVVKIGHSHAGVGKMRADSPADALEAANLAAVASTYCTVEPFIESKCDLRVQKIGNNYKAFLRKSLCGNWKANVGSSMLEQVAVSEQQRRWVDEFSAACGGLDIVALELVQGKDGHSYIIDAIDSSMPLLGDSQEDDRRLIADLVLQRMHVALNEASCRPPVGSANNGHCAVPHDVMNVQQRLASPPSEGAKLAHKSSPPLNGMPQNATTMPPTQPGNPAQSPLANAHQPQSSNSRRVLPQEPHAQNANGLATQANGAHNAMGNAPNSGRMQVQNASPNLAANRSFPSPRSSISANGTNGNPIAIAIANGNSNSNSNSNGNGNGNVPLASAPNVARNLSTATYNQSPIREREIKLGTPLPSDNGPYMNMNMNMNMGMGMGMGMNAARNAARNAPSGQASPRNLQQLEATEDTMQNLRTTFAGIFGEMPQ